MNLDGSGVRMVSSGRGRTTCSCLFPSRDRILYATTELHGAGAREEPWTAS